MNWHKSPLTKGFVFTAASGMMLLQVSGVTHSLVNAQQKSSVQQELEKLYQQEGRQAPSMQIQNLPRQTLDGRVFQEAAEPGQPPVSSAPKAQAQPSAQNAGAFQANPSQIAAPTNPPVGKRSRRFLDRLDDTFEDGFEKLQFWKKKNRRSQELPEQSITETPAQETPQQPYAQQRPEQPTQVTPPATPAAKLPTNRYQRPDYNQPAPTQPRILSPQKTPVRTAQPFPAQPEMQQTKPAPATRVARPAQPRSDELPAIIPQGETHPLSNPSVGKPSRVVISIPQQEMKSNPAATASTSVAPATPSTGKALPPAPDPFDPTETVSTPAPSKPAPVADKQAKPLPVEEAPAQEATKPILAAEVPGQPELKEEKVVEKPKAETTPAAKLPSLDELPNEPLPIISEEKPEPEPGQPPMVDEFFPDPFTEMSENEADVDKNDMTIPDIKMNMNDVSNPDEPITPIPENTEETAELPSSDEKSAQPMPVEEGPSEPLLEEENPFSGLKLDGPVAPLPQATKELKAAPGLPMEEPLPMLPLDEDTPEAAPALPELNPTFEDEFKLPVKQTPEEAMPELPKLEKIPEAIPQLPNAEQGDISWEEEEARRAAKLDLIAAREGETGLKGFCIVSLRDYRDLVDALPSFRSTYNLRTYHFASLAAKIEFDKDPRKYVPAYDGNDPILLSTHSEEREGSLDFALWFKGRLYLFTNQENLETFSRDPVLYAEN